MTISPWSVVFSRISCLNISLLATSFPNTSAKSLEIVSKLRSLVCHVTFAHRTVSTIQEQMGQMVQLQNFKTKTNNHTCHNICIESNHGWHPLHILRIKNDEAKVVPTKILIS